MELRYTNPLVSTLAHYELELEETLERHGVTATRNPARPVEGLSGLPGKAQMFANAALNIAKFTPSSDVAGLRTCKSGPVWGFWRPGCGATPMLRTR